MKLETFIQQCLENPEFRKYWEEDIEAFNRGEIPEEVERKKSLTIQEALQLLDSDSLETIITNKGIKATSSLSTDIEFFEKKDGTCPVAEFLQDIDNHLLNIVNLSNQGKDARPPLSKYIDDGIYELRTKQSSNITRVFYFFVFGNKIILTNGYIKKSEKMDDNEFEKAKKYRNEYSRRK